MNVLNATRLKRLNGKKGKLYKYFTAITTSKKRNRKVKDYSVSKNLK